MFKREEAIENIKEVMGALELVEGKDPLIAKLNKVLKFLES